MLTKRQVLYCLQDGRKTKEKKEFLKEIEESDREFFTDEEVQKFQMRSQKIQLDFEKKRDGNYPRTRAEWDVYDSIHHNSNSWGLTNDSDYDEYNGCYESIWD